MTQINTGIYKSIRVTPKKKEIKISKNKLEKNIEEIEKTIVERKPDKSYKLNVESLERINRTGKMLLEGYKIHEIAFYLGLKESTIENYIFRLMYLK